MPARGAAGDGHPARAQQHGRLHAVGGSGTAQDTNEAREYRGQQKPGETQIKCARVVSFFISCPISLRYNAIHLSEDQTRHGQPCWSRFKRSTTAAPAREM